MVAGLEGLLASVMWEAGRQELMGLVVRHSGVAGVWALRLLEMLGPAVKPAERELSLDIPLVAAPAVAPRVVETVGDLARVTG